MKTLLCLFAMMLCFTRANASDLWLSGDLTWNITDPQCSFRLNGKLWNSGTDSGSLRLALWANPFPDQNGGTLVALCPLGPVQSGSYISNFTFKTTATIPPQNGEVYYTIMVMEFSTAGWVNRIRVPTGSRTMFQGQFADQEKWILPRKALVEPAPDLMPGNLLLLKEKAMGNLNRFPAGWRERYVLDVETKKGIEYKNRNVEEKVSFKYKVLSRKYLGKKADVGFLEMTYEGPGNFQFTKSVYLFFHGPRYGTYMSSVKGSFWGESTNPWTTWGSFKLK